MPRLNSLDVHKLIRFKMAVRKFIAPQTQFILTSGKYCPLIFWVLHNYNYKTNNNINRFILLSLNSYVVGFIAINLLFNLYEYVTTVGLEINKKIIFST